jgi:hypothetical protein
LALVLAVLSGVALGSDFGSIKGRVLDAATRNAVIGAAVEIEGTDCGATTQDDGTFQIDGVAPGIQHVLASAVGYKSGAENVDVAAGTTAALDFNLTASEIQFGPDISADTLGTVLGRVTGDSTRTPIADALVEVVGTGLAVLSDLSGAYSIGEVPHGYYHVRARAVGYADQVSDSVRCDYWKKTVDFRLVRANGDKGVESRRTVERAMAAPIVPKPVGPPPSVEWMRVFNDSGDAYGYSVKSASDGGYVVAGEKYDSGGRCPYLVKTDSLGIPEWERTFPGRRGEFDEVQLTRDGGYIACGAMDYDAPVMKLDKLGRVQWVKDLAPGGGKSLYCIQQTSDGGYVVGGDDFHTWVAKLDSAGEVGWSRDCGNSPPTYYDLGRPSVRQTRDGEFVAVGKDETHQTQLTKLDKDGKVVWTRVLRGRLAVGGSCHVEPTPDGGFIVAGRSASDRKRGVYCFASLTRFSSNGRGLWRRLFSRKNWNEFRSVAVTKDGGFLATGTSMPISGIHIVLDPEGGEVSRGCVAAFDSRGYLKWAAVVGPSSAYGDAQGIAETQDGGCVVTGTQTDWNGNNSRMYLLKLAPSRKR